MDLINFNLQKLESVIVILNTSPTDKGYMKILTQNWRNAAWMSNQYAVLQNEV